MKQKNWKRRIGLIALVVACAAVAAYGSAAYFTTESTARNVITAGGVKIELQESQKVDTGLIPFEGPIRVLPDSTVSKIVQVKNTGRQPAYIRVRADKLIQLSEMVEGEADPTLISMDLNTEQWTERDGFFYYEKALAPGEVTEPLFTEVHFDGDMGNLYQGSQADIVIYAYAVQTANNGNTVWDAAGWPAAE